MARYSANQEVVYIGPDLRSHPTVLLMGISVPIPQNVYTIRDCMNIELGLRYPMPGPHYLLNEIRNEVRNCIDIGANEMGWVPHPWLRPVEKKSSAIEDLLALQNPANHKILEPA